jgi:hypothetical protein
MSKISLRLSRAYSLVTIPYDERIPCNEPGTSYYYSHHIEFESAKSGITFWVITPDEGPYLLGPAYWQAVTRLFGRVITQRLQNYTDRQPELEAELTDVRHDGIVRRLVAEFSSVDRRTLV